MSAAKEKPICCSHSGKIVQGVHLESPITPKARPRSVSLWGVPALQLLSTRCELHGVSALWENRQPPDLLAHLG